MDLVPGGIYRHYKGKYYKALFLRQTQRNTGGTGDSTRLYTMKWILGKAQKHVL